MDFSDEKTIIAVERSLDAGKITRAYVQATLESAGQTLAMFPRGFGTPQGHRSTWPDVMREMVICVDQVGRSLEVIMPDMDILKAKATTKQITELEMVFDWMITLSNYQRRNGLGNISKVIWLAMLHHPVTGKRLFGWKRISKKMTISHMTAKRWYFNGIDIITRELNTGGKK